MASDARAARSPFAAESDGARRAPALDGAFTPARSNGALRVALLTTFHQRCGIATYAENLVEGVRAHGVEVVILAPHLGKGDVELGDQPKRMWRRNRAFGFEALAVVREIERAQCDVVHLNVNLSLFSSRFLFNVVLLLRAKGIPVVATMHGRQGGSLGRRFKMWRLYAALRGAHVVVHNQGHAEELRARGHRDVHVIPHGMPDVQRKPIAEARASLGLDPTRKVLAHFGFLVPDKGVLEVLEAVAELRKKRIPSLFYWISGAVYHTEESQAHFAELRAAIARLGLQEHVHLTGEFVSHDEATTAMQAADWVVLNYRTGNAQGSSGAITRAFGSGRPIAVSAAPVFDDVRAGAHTLRGTVDLATALAEILEDDALAEATMRRGHDYCARTSWSKIGERHLALYRSLARRKVADAP